MISNLAEHITWCYANQCIPIHMASIAPCYVHITAWPPRVNIITKAIQTVDTHSIMLFNILPPPLSYMHTHKLCYSCIHTLLCTHMRTCTCTHTCTYMLTHNNYVHSPILQIRFLQLGRKTLAIFSHSATGIDAVLLKIFQEFEAGEVVVKIDMWYFPWRSDERLDNSSS